MLTHGLAATRRRVPRGAAERLVLAFPSLPASLRVAPPRGASRLNDECRDGPRQPRHLRRLRLLAPQRSARFLVRLRRFVGAFSLRSRDENDRNAFPCSSSSRSRSASRRQNGAKTSCCSVHRVANRCHCPWLRGLRSPVPTIRPRLRRDARPRPLGAGATPLKRRAPHDPT
jgi:hypothetical protein